MLSPCPDCLSAGGSAYLRSLPPSCRASDVAELNRGKWEIDFPTLPVVGIVIFEPRHRGRHEIKAALFLAPGHRRPSDAARGQISIYVPPTATPQRKTAR